jgi:hypothetical protein
MSCLNRLDQSFLPAVYCLLPFGLPRATAAAAAEAASSSGKSTATASRPSSTTAAAEAT